MYVLWVSYCAGFADCNDTVQMTGGIVAAGAAAQSVDMLGDLRTGYLLGASPRVQFIAQAVGSAFSVVLCCGFFVLFANAYPCILDADASVCQVRRRHVLCISLESIPEELW